ncbi:MAG: AAA family ATPase [Chitinophagales bacterium]|nr:AAA family ATPase [Chitinophagales bacterium]
MQIQTLRLKNFRNFGDDTTSFELNPHFNVVIGANGSGKSTLLDALRIVCGTYLLGIPDSEYRDRGKAIEFNDIRRSHGMKYELHTPVVVEADGILITESTKNLALPITWRRQIPLNKTKTTATAEDVGMLRDIAQNSYQQMQQPNVVVDLPVLAFFDTCRLCGAGQSNLKTPRAGRDVFGEGYKDWKSITASNAQYPRWLGSYNVLLKNGREYAGTKEAFMEALFTANPYIEEAEFEAGELWLKTDIDGEKQDFFPLSLCSDGIRSFTNIVAELAFRCIVLNAHYGKDAVKKSYGVVMIDELDLHLHPNWQRQVVGNLKAAFPNLQFVVSTHSPFIVQSLRSDELITLGDMEGLEKDPRYYSIEDVAEAEMGIHDMPRSKHFVDMLETAKQYYALIAQGKSSKTDLETASLRKKLNELEERYSTDAAFVAFLKMKREAINL